MKSLPYLQKFTNIARPAVSPSKYITPRFVEVRAYSVKKVVQRATNMSKSTT